MPCVPPSFYRPALTNLKKKKAAIVIFNFISQGELNFQLHINERTNVEKKSVLNGPFIGGAK